MQRADRNDPCPCGSGKKYKKCHLDEDLAAREKPSPTSKPAPEPTAHEQRWSVLFKQLTKASPDEMLRLGRAYIEAEPEFDEQDAFMLIIELLEPALAKAKRDDELRPLIELIRQRHPSAYAANVGYFAKRALDEAYESARDPGPHLLEWARTPTHQFEYLERALEQSLFHGRESLALETLETVKQAPVGDEDWFDHAKSGLAAAAVEMLFAKPGASAVSPTVIALNAAFNVFGPEELTRRLAHAERSTPLRLDELNPSAGPGPLVRQLSLLVADFARWLVRAQSWPAGRAALAHLGLERLIANRVEDFTVRPGAIEYEFDEDDAFLEETGEEADEEADSRPREPRWQGSPPGLGALLGLEEKRLSRHLAAQSGMFGTGAYRGAAVLLALPHWRPYLLELGAEPSGLADPARWLESSSGRTARARLVGQLDRLAGRALQSEPGA